MEQISYKTDKCCFDGGVLDANRKSKIIADQV